MTDQPLLTTESLVCGYQTPLLEPVDVSIAAEDMMLVEGPNGIGKSTLLRTIAGLQAPISGSIHWTSAPAHRRFVPQVASLQATLPATVADVVALGTQRSFFSGLRPAADRRTIDARLDAVGMQHAADELFRTLSEGQKQLVLLARALMGEPEFFLLDEPTASMDPKRETDAFETLADTVRDRQAAMLVVAHGSDAARATANRVLRIRDDGSIELQREAP